MLIAERLQPALARLRDASQEGRPVAVAAYTSRPPPPRSPAPFASCSARHGDCNRLCTARRSDLASCDDAAGFDDRELFELVLAPGHRSPLYHSSHLAARFALGLATGQEGGATSTTCNGSAEIARVEVPDWLADDPELLALSRAMLVKQCQLGLGYPVAISEAHEQAVISGHDREEFRRLTLISWNSAACPTVNPPRMFPSGGPGSEPIYPVRPIPPTVVRFQPRRSVGPAAVMPEEADLECQEDHS